MKLLTANIFESGPMPTPWKCPKIFMGLALVHFQKYWLLMAFTKIAKFWISKSFISVSTKLLCGFMPNSHTESLSFDFLLPSKFAITKQNLRLSLLFLGFFTPDLSNLLALGPRAPTDVVAERFWTGIFSILLSLKSFYHVFIGEK